MMYGRIALFVSTLFFLFGTNCFAYSHPDITTSNSDSAQTEVFHNNSTLTVVTVSNNTNIQASGTKTTKNETENGALLMKNNQSVEPSLKDYLVPVIVCLILIGLSSYWFIVRRKHV